jgi:hypothetical protein
MRYLMKIRSIFKESLCFPLQNLNKLMILGLLFIIINSISLFPLIGATLNSTGFNGIFRIFVLVLKIIFMIIVLGYSVNIVKQTYMSLNKLPEFNFYENFINGIKVICIAIIYSIIPLILTIAVGLFNGTIIFILDLTKRFILDITGIPTMISYLLSSPFSTQVITIFSIAIILFILFGLIAFIGILRFVREDKLSSAFEFDEIINTIKKITWKNYLTWWVIFALLITAMLIVTGVIMTIPFVGLIITTFIFYPFITVFISKAIGLIGKLTT